MDDGKSTGEPGASGCMCNKLLAGKGTRMIASKSMRVAG